MNPATKAGAAPAIKPKAAKPKSERVARREAEKVELRRQQRQAARKIRDEAHRHAREAAKSEALKPRSGGRRVSGSTRFVPTVEDRARVETLAGLGMRQDEIALLVTNPRTGGPIGLETLNAHFAVELARGGPKANSIVAKALYDKAIGKGSQAVTAAIWWTKARMGWRESMGVEVEIKSGVLVAPAKTSADEWIEQAAIDAAKKAAG